MKVGAKSSPPAVERLGLGLKKKKDETKIPAWEKSQIWVGQEFFQEQNEGPPTQPCLNGNVTEQKDESVNIQKQRKWQQLNCSFPRNTHVGLTSHVKEVQQKVSLAGGSFQSQVEPFLLQIQKRCQTRKHKPRRANNATNFASQASTKLKTGQAPKK